MDPIAAEIVHGIPPRCEWCGETLPLKPFGPNGESICFFCYQNALAPVKAAIEARMMAAAAEQAVKLLGEALRDDEG